MQTAFQEYTKKDNTKVKYYDLIMPKGTSTTYWIASRCVNVYSDFCGFCVSIVSSGTVSAGAMYGSKNQTGAALFALFPVVTLNSKLVKPDTEGTFVVSWE